MWLWAHESSWAEVRKQSLVSVLISRYESLLFTGCAGIVGLQVSRDFSVSSTHLIRKLGLQALTAMSCLTYKGSDDPNLRPIIYPLNHLPSSPSPKYYFKKFYSFILIQNINVTFAVWAQVWHTTPILWLPSQQKGQSLTHTQCIHWAPEVFICSLMTPGLTHM